MAHRNTVLRLEKRAIVEAKKKHYRVVVIEPKGSLLECYQICGSMAVIIDNRYWPFCCFLAHLQVTLICLAN